jgi:hypothetical protein
VEYHPFPAGHRNALMVYEGWYLASPPLPETPERWQTVLLLMVVQVVDVSNRLCTAYPSLQGESVSL